MAITKTSSLGDTLPTIIASARFTEQFGEVISKRCWRIKKKLHSGLTVNLPYWGIVTAQGLTEGVDMVNGQAMEDTNVQFTPAEVGAQIIITDKLVRDNAENVLVAGGRILGNAMVTKREEDLAAQLDDATASMGATGTTLTLGHLAAAHARLAGNPVSAGGPAPKPYVAFHHPYVLLDIVDVLTPILAVAGTAGHGATAGGVADEFLRNYLRGRLFGMDIYECGNIAIDSTPDAKGGIIAAGEGGGLVLVIADEWDIKPEYDASRRATELNIVGEYAVGEYLAGWIVELFNDATTPA